jgi:dTDP-4-amino-4,6-dideoxygalactose transaminase
MRGEVDKYTWRDLGSSWLMSELQAALLTAQLEEADGWQGRRQAIWQVYSDALAAQTARLGIQLQAIPDACVQPAHLFALLLPKGVDRSALIGRLRAAGVQATSHFEPLHRAPASEDPTELPITSDVAARLVRLPMHVHLTPDDARTIAGVLIDTLESLL